MNEPSRFVNLDQEGAGRLVDLDPAEHEFLAHRIHVAHPVRIMVRRSWRSGTARGCRTTTPHSMVASGSDKRQHFAVDVLNDVADELDCSSVDSARQAARH
jgi:hypothetical protein